MSRPVRLEPPDGGTILRVIQFPPDKNWRGKRDVSWTILHRSAPITRPVASHSDPMMHITGTVDYIIVLKGEIYAVMDKGETLLKRGDVLVQRGTITVGTTVQTSPA